MNTIDRIRAWIDEKGYDGVILSRRDNFAWVTGGKRNYVLESSEYGIASLVIKQDSIDLISDNIDIQRIYDEEIGFNVNGLSYPWYQSNEDFIKSYIGTDKMASDTYLPGTTYELNHLIELRMQLTQDEIFAYKFLGKECAEVVESICRLSKGMTEEGVASKLKELCAARGIHADCILVGSDDRILNYRHPMPTRKLIKDSLMVVLGAEKNGLYISLTRMVYFQSVPYEIEQRYKKNQWIFSFMQTIMKEGMSYKEYFEYVKTAYAEVGWGDEWKQHHQGGPTGFACREFIATPNENRLIRNNQAYAWNPSITGTKCEDTCLLTEDGMILLSMTDNWPRSLIKTEYGETSVADILIL